MQGGKPAFVVIPYEEYIAIFPQGPRIPVGGNIPHEVIGLVVKRDFSLVRAWREYLGLTQKEVAKRMGITQAALSQIEEPGKRPRKVTLEKIAAALGLTVDQVNG